MCWAGASSGVSSISELNRFVVGRASPNQYSVFLAFGCSCSSMFRILSLFTVCHFSLVWDLVGCSKTWICSDVLGGSLSLDGPAIEVSLCT